MITLDTISSRATVAHSAMEVFSAHKYVNHCFIAIFYVGEGRVSRCIKEGILNAYFMGEIEGEEVGTTRVTLGRTMGTKHRFEFLTIVAANFGVNVGTHDEMGIF